MTAQIAGIHRFERSFMEI